MSVKLRETPLLDELDKGPWPSFVREIKKSAEGGKEAANDLLGVLEQSYRDKISHWKHGGIVGVMGYGGGVIGRYSDVPEEYPNVAHFHTIRVNQPSGWFYTSDILRKVCDIWDKHGSGITNMHGSTGDLVLLGCTTDALEPVFADLTNIGFDLGGSGSDMRTPSCCCGQARCEYACYDTMAICDHITQHFQDELHRPAFPYKYKFKFSGCGNDCVASIARSDCSLIGTWKDDIQIDAKAVSEYAAAKVNIARDVVGLCPTKCMNWDGSKLTINNNDCVRCMHCINVMPKALRPGKERGATILIGAKAPIIGGALLATVMVPFMEIEPPYEDLKELTEAIWDLWGENGKNRERVGEFIQRIGMGTFLDQIGLDPIPEMVIHPRTNPYIFFEMDDEDEE
jgi:dissimilatory sulfite reductase alpha subunit